LPNEPLPATLCAVLRPRLSRLPRPSRLIALIAGCVVVLGGVAGILVTRGGRSHAPQAVRQSQTDNPVPAASPGAEAPPLDLPPLPSPIPAAPDRMFGLSLPAKAPAVADERAPSQIIQIGRIQIPSIHIDHTIFEGVTLTVVDHGPGHWPGSAMPGDPGNTVFAGHRTTHDKPFGDLDLVKVGDQITFELGGRRAVYKVTRNFIVDGTDTDIALPTAEPTMTLFACHPKGSAAQRIVVQGTLLSTGPA
jgi:LPXTG-site transpeptidase (sortase) family protein